MSRAETATTIASSVFAALGSHVFCCGILPLALNASANAVLGGLGFKIGFAVLTVGAVAGFVTLFEKHRHERVCISTGCGCRPAFDWKHHFARNLLIGMATYGFFYMLTNLPVIHQGFENLFGLSHQ